MCLHVTTVLPGSKTCPPTPAYSQSLGGEAPGTPQGESSWPSLAEPFQALPKACPRPRQLAGLLRPLCGLSKACLLSRQLAGLLRPLCGLSEACLLSSYGLPKATLGILDRLQTLLGSWQACCGLSVACPKPASLSSYGLPKATLGILDRLQTLLGSWQACCGLSVACPKPASSLLMGFRRRR